MVKFEPLRFVDLPANPFRADARFLSTFQPAAPTLYGIAIAQHHVADCDECWERLALMNGVQDVGEVGL